VDEVYVAIFESGNRTTILGGGSTLSSGFPPTVVNDPLGPYGGVNPPPNDGPNFRPAQRPGNPPPPRVGLIVKKSSEGRWMDDNRADWTNLVTGAQAARSGRRTGWDLFDHDLAVIDTGSLAVSYATDAMNICMALAVNPATGRVSVVGTDATNEVRFEPVLAGRFLRVELAAVDPSTLVTTSVVDLNSHLTYTDEIPFVSIAQAERDKSLGDPRAIVWRASGDRGYVAGMGSHNVLVIDAEGNRVPPIGRTEGVPIEVGDGPTGLALNEQSGLLYVLNRFSASISVIDLTTELVIHTVRIFDPSPAAIKIGRKHLYDTHRNSGLGHIACGSCHVDARMDRIRTA
jgi:YVTN family beta-propeller protein